MKAGKQQQQNPQISVKKKKKKKRKERKKDKRTYWESGSQVATAGSLARPYIPLVVDFGWRDGSKEVAEAVRAQQLLGTAQSRNY